MSSARCALGPLLERLGVSTDVVKDGAWADLFFPSRRLDEGERAVVERDLYVIYVTFLDVVARRRRRAGSSTCSAGSSGRSTSCAR
ncbi:S49 family peptidase [Sorangium sp. So ce362]|uniref:S49 family peptidase n=1 Tax=Sorangium sp. So ce362 TaxID=3133303 RepID=UPI003F6433D9